MYMCTVRMSDFAFGVEIGVAVEDCASVLCTGREIGGELNELKIMRSESTVRYVNFERM